jgi:hypothetical protein
VSKPRHERPEALDEFGERLRAAAVAQIERERNEAAPKKRRSRRAVAGAILAVLLPAGALAGAGALRDNGDPLPRDRGLPGALGPSSDPSVLSSTAVADPAGGPPWALKLFANEEGEECVAVGRLRNGALGQFHGRVFRAYPAAIAGVCGQLAKAGILYGIERRSAPHERTVIYGVSAGRAPVELRAGGRRAIAEPGALGSFIIVLSGVRPLNDAELRTQIDDRPLVFDVE